VVGSCGQVDLFTARGVKRRCPQRAVGSCGQADPEDSAAARLQVGLVADGTAEGGGELLDVVEAEACARDYPRLPEITKELLHVVEAEA